MLPRRVPLRPLARVAAVLIALVTILGLTAACSNGSSVAAKRGHTGTATATNVSGTQKVTITTGDDLRFHPSTIVVHPGKVQIVLDNTAKAGSGPPHNVKIVGLPGQSQFADAGNTVMYNFTAPAPGTYQFICQLHVDQGQTGSLIVKKS